MSEMSSAQLRKIRKPLIERKRRERINESLNVLKSLILDAVHRDESQYEKMEKADILEMAVDFFRTNRSQASSAAAATASLQQRCASQYQAGYRRCVQEVNQVLASLPGYKSDVRNRLMSHLNTQPGQMPPQVPTAVPVQRVYPTIQLAARLPAAPPPPVRPVPMRVQQHHDVDINNNVVGSTVPDAYGYNSNGVHSVVARDLSNVNNMNNDRSSSTEQPRASPGTQAVSTNVFSPITVEISCDSSSSSSKSLYTLGSPASDRGDNHACVQHLRNSPASRKLEFENDNGQAHPKMASCGESVWRPW